MMETPDGHGRLELVKFHSPSVRGGDGHAPANILGIRHVAFVVDDIDAAVATVRARGGELVDRQATFAGRARAALRATIRLVRWRSLGLSRWVLRQSM